MRHLYGFALAVLLAAAVFFGAAWGYAVFNRAIEASTAASSIRSAAAGGGLPAAGGSLFPNIHLAVGGGVMLAVALAVGLLMVIPWVSPLAAGLPGLVLVAWTVLYVSNVREAVRLIPLKTQDFGAGFESLLFSGLLGMAGVAMIIPLFIPSRWRRPSRAPRDAAPVESMGGFDLYPTITDFATPTDEDSDVLPGWEHTRPQQGPVIPPGGSQPPWGPPEPG